MMAADYRHIGGLENRLGRHYSRFSASGPAAPLAAQSLARRKSPNHGSNRRSQVSTEHAVTLSVRDSAALLDATMTQGGRSTTGLRWHAEQRQGRPPDYTTVPYRR